MTFVRVLQQYVMHLSKLCPTYLLPGIGRGLDRGYFYRVSRGWDIRSSSIGKCGLKVNIHEVCAYNYVFAPCAFSDGCDRILKLSVGAQWLNKNTMIIGQSLVVPPGIRPPKMPTGKGIRTQKWSNPPLCPVGGRWGMTLIGA